MADILPIHFLVFSVIVVSSTFPKLIGADIDSYLREIEVNVDRLAADVKLLYSNKCGTDCSYLSSSNELACTTNDISEHDGTFCSTDYGESVLSSNGCQLCSNRKLNSAFSTVRTSSESATCSEEVTATRCWSKGLDATFQEIGTWSPELIRWQFFASSTGMFRIHPGIAQEKCYDFDPRSRYWYVSASTGPKDIVILLDTSESMSFVPPSSGTSETLFKLAKSAIKHVLRTLNFVDYVAIVLFSTEANQLTIQGKSTLMKATRANLFDLMEELDKVTLDLHTNFEAGFRLAFDILDRSARVGRTANCHKTVLFLTDGAPTRGETDAAKLRNIVQQFNTDSDGNKIATIFTYSIGQYAETAITKQIACDAGGVWSQIEDVETSSLTEQLSQYYNYYGSLQKGETNIMWTEPIMDAFGADEVVTAAKLIITKEPGEMGSNNVSSSIIGIVGMHISVEGLLAKDTSSSREDLLTLLESLALKCPQIEAGGNCALESLRQHVFTDDVLTYRQDESKLCDLNSAQECPLPNNTICHDRTFQYDECEQQKLENQDYVEASCCGSYDKSCPISSAHNVSFTQWLLSVCTLAMFVGS